MKKLHNITKRGTGTKQDLYDHIVERMNENLAEIAAEVGELSLEEGTPYFPVKILTYEVEGSNGNILALVKGQEVTSGDEVIVGKDIQFFAGPDGGYLVKRWKKDGDTVENHIDDSLVLTMPDADMEVKVEFIQAHELTFGVEGSGGGITAEVDGDPVQSGDRVRHEKEVVFTAAPEDGYRVKDWITDGTGESNTDNTFTVSSLEADKEVKVEYELIHEVTFDVEGEGGTLAAEVDSSAITSGDFVADGKNVVFTAAAESGQEVSEWKVNGEVVEGVKTEEYTVENLDNDIHVTVEFKDE